MSSPAKRMRLSANRTSLSSRKSLGGGGTGNALRTTTTSANTRHTATQPTYDFISGEIIDPTHERIQAPNPSQSLRKSTSRQSMLPKPEQPVSVVSQQKHQEEVLALRSKINSLDYELKNIQSERGLLVLQHEKELRDAQARADTDYRKYQEAETEKLKAIRQYESAVKEVKVTKDSGVNDKTALERKLRDLQGQNDILREEKEDAEGRLGEVEREMRRILVEEVEGKRSILERTLDEFRGELEEMHQRFENVNKKLQQKEQDVETLENEVLHLKGNAGGGEELEVLKREFGEQVAYVRRLEAQNREQGSELRRLRDERRGVNVVEEEKRALEVQLQVYRDMEKRMGEIEIQREILEDEKRIWTSLLEREGEEKQREFDSPEAVVKALVNERIEHALTLDRLGGVESELAGKDEVIKNLSADKRSLEEDLKRTKDTPTSPTENSTHAKAYKRLDRLRQLAAKEVEYLRAQLKTFDSEETIMMENANFDAQRSEQVQKLESLVDQYKSEIQTLHSDLTKLETTTSKQSQEPRGTKRAAESQDPENDSQLGAVLRKNKNLQIALQKTTQQSQMLATELQANKSQLKALRLSSQTRVLELRDNPTAQAETIKQMTLRVLKQENADLMAQLRTPSGDENPPSNIKTVPASSLDALRLDLQDMEGVLADKDKRMRRQRDIWTEKAAEFRDVIASVLGYKVTFLPNGKVKVSSLYYGRRDMDQQLDAQDGEDADEEEENYIMFDGENGTMKISGGNDGPFGRDVREQVDFWVKDKKEIPCFLAACTLEFYERFHGSEAAVES